MIQLNSINLSFGSQKIFDHISATFNGSDRIGLVGDNGSGKSTLLKAIVAQNLLDGGSISIVKQAKIAYMPQDVVLQSEKSIFEETFTAYAEITTLQNSLRELEATFAVEGDAASLERYASLQDRLQELEPDKAAAQTKRMLLGLGFTEASFDLPVASLSVGWKMRVVLAKLLLQNADFYLFDEPTNHLDLVAKEWFLQFLKGTKFGFLLVCHERYFLDELCNKIFALERGTGKMYTGTYSTYERQKEEALEQLRTAHALQQRELKRKIATVERFRASASKAAMAQSMLKSIEKTEIIEIPPDPREVSFHFPLKTQPGKVVLTVTKVAHAFGTKKVFEQVSFGVERGEKIAVIAPNGAGKTTLFNVITGKLPLQQGSVVFGHNVQSAIFAQEQGAVLDSKISILDNIKMVCPTKLEPTIRTLLGSFLFSNDDVHKKVGVLSGGEKNRVGMAIVLLQDANLLLLDEPTNHLDIRSKEILLKALQEYAGTILFVSHDRDFVNKLATHILELTPAGVRKYEGNYDDYAYQKQQQSMFLGRETPTSAGNKPTAQEEKSVRKVVGDNKAQFELHKQARRIEQKVEKLEREIQHLELEFMQLDRSSPHFTPTHQKLIQLKKELKAALEQWELLYD